MKSQQKAVTKSHQQQNRKIYITTIGKQELRIYFRDTKKIGTVSKQQNNINITAEQQPCMYFKAANNRRSPPNVQQPLCLL
jgi:hypothetical protein